MNPKSFILYIDLLGSLDQLSDAQAGKLFKAIKAYHMSVSEGATQDCKAEFDSLMDDFVTRLAFHPFRAAFERDAEKYQSLVARNRNNGKKGGRKKKIHAENPENPVGSLGFSENPNKPNETQTKLNDNDNENDNDNDINIVPPKGGTCQASQPDVAVPYQEIMDFWNKAMNGKAISGINAITSTSKRGISVKARFKEYGIEKIYQTILNASGSDFLNGKNSRTFTATFDWVFLPSNFIKVLDGNYRNKEPIDYEQSRTDRQVSPSGGVPIRGRVTPSCGLKKRDTSGET